MKRAFGAALVCVVVLSWTHARAAQLENISPGLMCESEEALAKLSMPDGSSKLDRPGMHPEEGLLFNQGRCLKAPAHIRVNLVTGRRQTSIVTYDNNDSRGPVTYYVANIAFKPPTGPSTCVAVDTKATVRGRLSVVASKDKRNGSAYTYIVIHSERSYCIEPSLDGGNANPSRDMVVYSTDADPKQTTLRNLNGQTITLSGRLSDDRNGGLMLSDSQITP